MAPLPDVGYLLDWAQALVAEHLKTGTPAGRSLPPAAGHPLVERWSKEDYNIAAEFQAALAGHSYREACQIISSPGGIASSAAALLAGLAALRRKKAAPADEKPSWLQTIFKGAGLVSTLWLAFRSRGRDQKSK